MKKKIIVIGIIILLAVVGLSGCTEESETNRISVEELLLHLDKYLNTTVTVKGFLYTLQFESGVTDKGYTILIKIPDSIDTDEFYATVEYYVTGILRRGTYEGVGKKVSYLEVSKIESA